MIKTTVQLAKRALETEILAVAIYQHLAESSRDKVTQKAYSDLSQMERGHVDFWTTFLNKRGVDASRVKPASIHIWYHKMMLKVLGRGLTLKIMENDENQAIDMYSTLQDSPDLDHLEKAHLKNVLSDELVHEGYFTAEESKLESFTLYIKDAVLGMSDGLVEILSVTTGLAGASGSTTAVAISGLVVGVAGGLSMGISTYSSSRSQRQVHEGTLKRISSASRFVGHLFKERVLNHLVKRGYSHRLSSEMAEETIRDHRLLSDVIAEQEYGLREANFGSPMKSGLYAGISNLVASFIPLLPYFFTKSIVLALILSIILATISLAITGFLVAILANLPPGKKIAEMVLTGLGTAAVTFGIGKLAAVFLGTKQ
jgi:VIT1/CCC1 family predicted Fe2+/Mn2+ transporter